MLGALWALCLFVGAFVIFASIFYQIVVRLFYRLPVATLAVLQGRLRFLLNMRQLAVPIGWSVFFVLVGLVLGILSPAFSHSFSALFKSPAFVAGAGLALLISFVPFLTNRGREKMRQDLAALASPRFVSVNLQTPIPEILAGSCALHMVQGELDGKPLIATVNTGLKDHARHPRYRHRVRIYVYVQAPEENGLPSQGVLNELSQIDALLCRDLCVNSEAVWAVTMTSSGVRELLFYTSDPESTERKIQCLQRGLSYQLRFDIERDEDWRAYLWWKPRRLRRPLSQMITPLARVGDQIEVKESEQ